MDKLEDQAGDHKGWEGMGGCDIALSAFSVVWKACQCSTYKAITLNL